MSEDRLAAALRWAGVTDVIAEASETASVSLPLEKPAPEIDAKCDICGGGNSSDRALAADHDHRSGQWRGFLCHKCNVGLGLFRDNVELLERAIEYLRLYQTQQEPIANITAKEWLIRIRRTVRRARPALQSDRRPIRFGVSDDL